jgi:hypothetical protein
MIMWDFIQKLFSIFIAADGTPGVQVNVPVGSDQTPKFNGTELKLVRDTYSQFSTQGQLYINGVWECFTIECPRVSYQGSHICIPEGTYPIIKYDSPTHGPDTPLLQNIPGRTEIEIHSSNYAVDPSTKKVYLLGCIALGTEKDPDVVYNSKVAVAALLAKIDWSKPIQIIVTE